MEENSVGFSLCDTPLWDWNLSWNSEHPRFTACFRHLILSIAPSLLLWVLFVVDHLLLKCYRPENAVTEKVRRHHPWTLLAVCKQVLTVLLLACAVIEGCYQLSSHRLTGLPQIAIASICVKATTFILALWLQVAQRRSGRLASHKLAIFWNLLCICQFFTSPIYDMLMGDLTEKTDVLLFVSGTISMALIAAEAFLSHFTDPQYDLLFCDSKTDEFLVDHLTPLSRLFFSWMDRLITYGYKNLIGLENLDSLRPDMKTTHVCEQFQKRWRLEQIGLLGKSATKWTCCGGPSLFMALGKAMWPWMLAAVCLEFLCDFASLVPPIILDWLIGFMDGDEPGWHGYVYALLLFGTAALSNLLMVHNLNFLIRASVIPRSGLNASVYRKMFRLSLSSRRGYSLGELCNLVLVDIQRMFELIWSVNLLWSHPLRMMLAIALLWRYLGVACLAGVAVLIALTPLTTVLAIWTHRVQKIQMEWKDSRLRTMNEIINGIKVLKLFAWEPPFMKRVEGVRDLETKALRKLAFLNGVIIFLWILAPFLVALFSFVVFELIDEKNDLTPSIAFVSLALFAKLRVAMSSTPQIIMEMVQARISVQRLVNFLLCEELDISANLEPLSPGNMLEMEDASFSWSACDPFLRNVDLQVSHGQLVAVVGRVGSGKSALLAAILGEMTRTQGSLRMDKTANLAYVQQTAWIQNTTLRQNVLFVSPMDKRRYDSVLRLCCLRPDLKILPGGDFTEIGEKGVNLSGGQKQRVNLARAVYHDADFYLLDDPLSAVDAHVSQSIFSDVIGPEGILRQKTRILVTHDLSILPQCDVVVLMSEGCVLEYGTYEDLQRKDGELTRLLNDFTQNQTDDQDDPETTPSPDPSSLTTEELKAQMRRIGQRQLSRTISVDSQDAAELPVKITNLIESEKMEVGGVRASVYWTYFRSAGLVIIFTMMAAFASHQAFEISSNVWLSKWSADSPLPDGSQNVPLRNFRIGVYGSLGLAQGICILLGTVMLAFGSTKASVRLHRSMLWSVMRSPMSFFDITPIGRILNRFGKDIHSVDVVIPTSINSVVTVLVSAAGTLFVICITHPLFLLIMVPVVIIYIFVQFFYMATSRQLRRLQSVTLSPILSFFSESIQGTSTIRAFAVQEKFTKRYDSLIDSNCRTFLTNTLTNRWLGIRLQLLGAAIVFIVAILSVLQRHIYSAALVGLTLSYALNVTDILAQMVRLMTQLETRMVSVERIDEYSKLKEEESWKTANCNLSLAEWPRQGSIEFKRYQMQYQSNSKPVLRGINLEIPGGQKVGVVGRTGAGKSSLAQALFRVIEPTEGALIIDGIDTALLGLHDLREKITVIPQDPVLFGGELRLNLDPSNEHSDEEVRTALRLASMEPPAGGLGMILEEGGENLSVGQRQQVCLARALLKRTKILVLDEATAAVDLETDRLIQETIRSEFHHCTVITVAHRLHTVLDYDRILVMDRGRIVEDGPPDVLLKKTDSLFRNLAQSAGLL